MPDLGIDVLFKGTNMLRLLQGLWVAMKISIVSILISMPLGILVGALMTVKNRVVKAIFRVYLEFIRIMPQLVLLFIVYFGSTRALGWNLSGEVASVIVFVLWGTAEMGDLVRGALISIPKHQYESSEALGLSKIQTYLYIIIPQTVRRLIPLSINPVSYTHLGTGDGNGNQTEYGSPVGSRSGKVCRTGFWQRRTVSGCLHQDGHGHSGRLWTSDHPYGGPFRCGIHVSDTVCAWTGAVHFPRGRDKLLCNGMQNLGAV